MLGEIRKKFEQIDIIEAEPPLQWEELREFRDIGVVITITKGTTGKKLKDPITIQLKPKFSKTDVFLLNYTIDVFIKDSPKLIPIIWSSCSLRELMAYLRRNKSGSVNTPYHYIRYILNFCDFIGTNPDDIITSLLDAEGNPIPNRIKWIRKKIQNWIDELLAEDLAPQSIKVCVSAVRTWLWVNEIEIGRIPLPKQYTKYQTRSPTPEELQKLIEVAPLREKAIISMLATSGLRVGTLVQLKYKHVKDDLEKGVVPVCIRIEPEITKGKYCDYFTFINDEAVYYLKLYLEERKKGSKHIPPEEINDDSPLFRTKEDRKVKPVTYASVYKKLHELMMTAGLICEGKRRHELNVHSLRKYFRTQLTLAGVPSDYIEFMMGHKISTYNSIKSLGVEKLREIYARSGISIKPKTMITKIEMLKEIVRSLGLDPEKILVKDALIEPKRTEFGINSQVEALQEAIRDWIRGIAKEIK